MRRAGRFSALIAIHVCRCHVNIDLLDSWEWVKSHGSPPLGSWLNGDIKTGYVNETEILNLFTAMVPCMEFDVREPAKYTIQFILSIPDINKSNCLILKSSKTSYVLVMLNSASRGSWSLMVTFRPPPTGAIRCGSSKSVVFTYW